MSGRLSRAPWTASRIDSVPPEVTVPTAVAQFPHEMKRLPRRWLERRFTDLRSFTTPEVGGHFASLEQPETFVDELRAFFRTVR